MSITPLTPLNPRHKAKAHAHSVGFSHSPISGIRRRPTYTFYFAFSFPVFCLPCSSGTGGCSFLLMCSFLLLSVPCGSFGSGRRIPAFAIVSPTFYAICKSRLDLRAGFVQAYLIPPALSPLFCLFSVLFWLFLLSLALSFFKFLLSLSLAIINPFASVTQFNCLTKALAKLQY